MRLHENKELFEEAIIATAEIKKIPEIYIEKDYWMTLALKTIFENEIGRESVFKGGTALSKCYQLIDRFSEDLDLVVLKKEGESGNQLKNKIKRISKCVEKILPEINIDGITNKFGMIRKTAHHYNKIFEGDFKQVRDVIIIESTWLGSFEPYTIAKVHSFIYEMMVYSGLEDVAKEYSLEPFEVRALSVERTLCEKIMSLVRFSQTEDAIGDLKNKIRHTYDIYMILQNENLLNFFKSEKFEQMLLVVANDDILSFKNNNKWLENHPQTAIIFSNTNTTWNQIKNKYLTDFKELVFGDFPEESVIKNTLLKVSERLKGIKWNIKIK
jgi:predicted nucleotidyltransferase component of viral defense system